MSEKIWLSSPHMGGGEEKYVKEAFDTNWVAPLGPNVNGFEEDLENYIGEQSNVACLVSGTSAIHLALILSEVGLNDEVICQSMTFSASANPIKYQGANPIFIDSEKDTWNMCPIALEEAIKDKIAKGKKPKAIIVVHLYGMPAKMDQIVNISKRYEISLGKIISEDYLNKFLNEYENDKFIMAKKLINGYDKNEVLIVEKTQKNRGFFEKFFNFFR